MNRVKIVFELLLHKDACCSQVEMANGSLVNKICITSLSFNESKKKNNNVRFPRFFEAIFVPACKQNSMPPLNYFEKNKYVIFKLY